MVAVILVTSVLNFLARVLVDKIFDKYTKDEGWYEERFAGKGNRYDW